MARRDCKERYCWSISSGGYIQSNNEGYNGKDQKQREIINEKKKKKKQKEKEWALNNQNRAKGNYKTTTTLTFMTTKLQLFICTNEKL